MVTQTVVTIVHANWRATLHNLLALVLRYSLL